MVIEDTLKFVIFQTLVGGNALDSSGNGKQFTELFGPPITAEATKKPEKKTVVKVNIHVEFKSDTILHVHTYILN